MKQEFTKPVLLEGDLLDLWLEVQKKFSAGIKPEGKTLPLEGVLKDPGKWPEILEDLSYQDKSYIGQTCAAVGRHMEVIQQAVQAMTGIFQLVAAVFVTIEANSEKIQAFFEKIAILFEQISIIGQNLRGDHRLSILRKNIVEVFHCSLQICAAATNDQGGRLKKWLEMCFKGDEELDTLFEQMESSVQDLSRCINFATFSEMQRLGQPIRGIGKHVDRTHRDQLLAWLSPLNFDPRHEELLSQVKGRPNAGRWLLDSKAFRDWKEAKGSRIWYTGKPTEQDPAVVFLYMSHTRDTTVRQLMGSIARQIVSEMISPHPDVEMGWKEKANRGKTEDGRYRQPSEEYLEKLLSKLTENRPLYVVLDAMDECKMDIRQELLEKVQQISKDVRILVTSRLLEKRNGLSEGFQMETIEADPSDMDEYIDYLIDKEHILSQGPRDRIKEVVVRKGGGMFLLVKLHMHALLDLDDSQDIDEALEQLPKTVEESYAITITRVNRKNSTRRNFANKIFGWMSYAYRPLKVQELSHAIAAQLSGAVIEKEMLLSKEKIMSFCCGLVEIDSDDVVRFVHYSAENFFKDKKERDFHEFLTEIPMACAKYLWMISSERQSALEGIEQLIEHGSVSEEVQYFPFASYATEYLDKHLQTVRPAPDEDPFSAIYARIDDKEQRNFYSKLLCQSKSYYSPSRPDNSDVLVDFDFDAFRYPNNWDVLQDFDFDAFLHDGDDDENKEDFTCFKAKL
ncbi:hypothetical protein AAE478_000244 [Parahypoxylon ruwenzoriense]